MKVTLNRWKMHCKHCSKEIDEVKTMLTLESDEMLYIDYDDSGVGKATTFREDRRDGTYGMSSVAETRSCLLCGASGDSVSDVAELEEYKESYEVEFDYSYTETKNYPRAYVAKAKQDGFAAIPFYNEKFKKDRLYITAATIAGFDIDDNTHKKHNMINRWSDRNIKLGLSISEFEFYKFKVPIVGDNTVGVDERYADKKYISIYYSLKNKCWAFDEPIWVLGEIILEVPVYKSEYPIVQELNKRKITPEEFFKMIKKENSGLDKSEMEAGRK